MALREDLERLAGECEVCSMADSASIDNHMITCPSCVEHRGKAEEIDRGVQHLRDLTEEPEIDRRHTLGYDYNDLLNMSESQRAQAMMDMFDNTVDLDPEQRTVIVKTRTDIMTSLPKSERDELVRTTRTIYSTYDEDRMAKERQAIEAATAQYNPLKRTMVRRMYRDMML